MPGLRIDSEDKTWASNRGADYGASAGFVEAETEKKKIGAGWVFY